MAVGSLEPQFYQQLMQGLDMNSDESFIEQFADFDEGKDKVAKRFGEKTQAEWTEIFDKLDACVTPVVEMDEAAICEPNVSRKSFSKNPVNGHWDPEPAPKLSRTPGVGTSSVRQCPAIGEHTVEVLREIGYDSDAIKGLLSNGTILIPETKSKI